MSTVSKVAASKLSLAPSSSPVVSAPATVKAVSPQVLLPAMGKPSYRPQAVTLLHDERPPLRSAGQNGGIVTAAAFGELGQTPLAAQHDFLLAIKPTEAATLKKAAAAVSTTLTTGGDLGPAAAVAADAIERVASAAAARGTSVDVQAYVQWVLRECYLDTTLNLQDYADKVRAFNAKKKAIREHLGFLREIEAHNAGLDDKEAGKTMLNGESLPGGGTTGELGSDATGKAPIIENPEDRQDYPGSAELVGQFIGFAGGKLEALLKNKVTGKELQQDLVQAIPYMTVAEAKKVLFALGGNDMNVGDDLDAAGIFARVFGAMRPDQIVGMAVSAKVGEKPHDTSDGEIASAVLTGGMSLLFGDDADEVTVKTGEAGTFFTSALGAAKAAMEQELGKSFADDLKTLLEAWKAQRGRAITDQKTSDVGAGDASAIQAIKDLLNGDSGVPITGQQMADLIATAIQDSDGQSAGFEYDDLKKFVEKYADQLAPGAQDVFQTYAAAAEAAREKGETVLGDKQERAALMTDLHALAQNRAGADSNAIQQFKTSQVATTQEEQKAAEAKQKAQQSLIDALVFDANHLDMDYSDGTIDSVTPSGQAPYLVASGEKITTVAQLTAEIKKLEEALNTAGDDAQLANVDMQNWLQKLQQVLQLMSNISKTCHDASMAAIRNMAG